MIDCLYRGKFLTHLPHVGVVLRAIRHIEEHLFGHGGIVNPCDTSISPSFAACPDQKLIVFIGALTHAAPH